MAMQDHPRLCGEKLGAGRRVFQRGGITPAYAGKSKSEIGAMIPHEDHPRACEEKIDPKDAHPRNVGSPPRMRGKVPFGKCMLL